MCESYEHAVYTQQSLHETGGRKLSTLLLALTYDRRTLQMQILQQKVLYEKTKNQIIQVSVCNTILEVVSIGPHLLIVSE